MKQDVSNHLCILLELMRVGKREVRMKVAAQSRLLLMQPPLPGGTRSE